MAKLAILGFGIVGSGVLTVLRTNPEKIAARLGEPLEAKYILDIRDFSDHPDAKMFVKDLETILADPEVKVVVETIGGTKFAYPFVKKALESGRSVVTSNKEMVAAHGAELLAIAKEKGVAFLFEASVGGGTPILTPLHQCLAANRISRICGIVNGTTNFMLTRMAQEDMGFEDALQIAQKLGYAETKDPSDDVDGLDAGRKIAILASLAFGRHIYPENVPTRGIRQIVVRDIAAAAKLDCVIKLIAWTRQNEDGTVVAGVEPMLVPCQNQLAGVNDVFNAVLATGDMVGDVMFYGRGAGSLATASAVVADAIDAAKFGAANHDSLFWQPSKPFAGSLSDDGPATYYVRLRNIPASVLPALYGPGELLEDWGDEAAFLAECIDSRGLREAQRKAEALGGSVRLVLRQLEA